MLHLSMMLHLPLSWCHEVVNVAAVEVFNLCVAAVEVFNLYVAAVAVINAVAVALITH